MADALLPAIEPTHLDHWSTCALHNGPAFWPMPCGCGGMSGALKRPHLRNFLQLWNARLNWKRENRSSMARFLLTVARNG